MLDFGSYEGAQDSWGGRRFVTARVILERCVSKRAAVPPPLH